EIGLGAPYSESIPARSATDDEIRAVHDPDFVRTVKEIDSGALGSVAGFEFGLGTPDDPIFPNMHRASAAVCGASIAAVEAVVEGRFDRAFNPAGGLHHARRREASGFCIYNDPAAAVAKILDLRPDWRVMYLDIDVHHGDGVQWIFFDEPRVLTVSIHESGHYLYPGTGFEDEIGTGDARGTAANFPLLPYTGDDDYLYVLSTALPALAEAFRPDAIVTQLGADTHWGDPLANLALTMRAYPQIAAIIDEVARSYCHDRWIATGGGGYQATTVVPLVWAIHFAQMCHRIDEVPSDWLADKPSEEVARPYKEHVERIVEAVLEVCLPQLSALATF
ncbi:MAG: acetoin utilization protein AcuC, partial [Actinomycetota bacterium]|nr:acetoin utilization protein AcuC [Actinomycetota bacterium]